MKIDNYGSRWNEIINKIDSVATKNNLNVFIVGGFCRDLLLKKECKDLDIMVDNPNGGMELAKLLSKEYNLHEPVLFPTFGTAKLKIDDEDVEFVAPRLEYYTDNSRKPKTEAGDLFADSMRRDFTINALFINIRTGELLDLTGKGIDDIENQTLRVTDPENADIIFSQDPLRLLRIIRFASQLNFSIDSDTYEAVKRNASKIQTISKERVQEELNKMLLTDKPSRALRLLKELGVLNYILPDLESLESTEEEGGTESKNVWVHTLQVIDNTPNNLAVRLAALFHDIGKPETKSRTYRVTCPQCSEKIDYIYKTQPDIGIKCQNGTCDGYTTFKTEKELYETFTNYDIHFYDHEKAGAAKAVKVLRGLKYSEEIIQEVKTLITHHMKGHAYDEDWTDSAVRRYDREANPYTQNLLDLTKSDITTKHPDRLKRKHEKIEKMRERIRLLNEQQESAKIHSPLDGNELMQMFPDKKAGEWLKNIKNFLLNEVIDGRLSQDDKEGAKRLLQNIDIEKLASDNTIIKLSWRD